LINYKNATSFTYILYGVTFTPGTVAPVPGFINIFGFIRVPELDQTPSVPAQPEPTEQAPRMTKRRTNNTGGEQLDG
jgi:hypothetical protein